MKNPRSTYGAYAVVTGASSGIGAEFATQFAAMGMDLVLVARRADRLQALAESLRSSHGVDVQVMPLDLAADGATEELVRLTADLDVGLVVLSAGVVTAGTFIDNDLADERNLIEVNLMAPMVLAHAYGRRFADAGKGAIVLVSSAVAFGAVPYTANYAAAKAYVASLGQAMHYELKRSGVDVLTLAPGPTRTEGAENAEGIDFGRLPMPMMSAERVVRLALRNVGRKSLLLPGTMTKVSDKMGRHLMPRRAQTAMYGRLVSDALTEQA